MTGSGRPGAQPVTGPPSRPVVVGTAVLLLALAALCAHDLLARTDLVGSTPATPTLARWIDAHHMTPWTPWVAGLALVLGAAVLVGAVSPRRRTHLGAADATLWLRPTDLARVCSARVLGLPGVTDAHTHVTRRRVDVTVRSPGRPVEEVHAAVEAAVTGVLTTLDTTPRLRVTVETGGRR